jgi:hypothetical protein
MLPAFAAKVKVAEIHAKRRIPNVLDSGSLLQENKFHTRQSAGGYHLG